MRKVSENIKTNSKCFEKGVDKCEKFDIIKLQKGKRNTNKEMKKEVQTTKNVERTS